MGPVEPETMSTIELTPENTAPISDSLDIDGNPVSNVKSSFDDFLARASETFSSSLNKGENAVKNSLDTITSSITSVKKSASEVVDNALGGVFSSVDQTGDLAGNKLTGFSTNLTEASSKVTVVAIDVLRRTIVMLEDSIVNGASLVVYYYGTTKEMLPPEIRGALNLSEERAIEIVRPFGSAFQQVSIAVEGLERSIGLDPNDPIVPFVLFLGKLCYFVVWMSFYLCRVFYWVWTYSGYSGDLSPKSTLELLTGKENAVLIDVRPEARYCKSFRPFI
ncbi:hypothetical protein Pint_26199 [Pistacia integerrima]|uniref:Uncharacterized protein n=1 Tax=Pistacia integerrima TaxID=434235 RepID=A0ACC0YFX0_9ROSI|nr:hypothetical protein Pint_26199 [Pistacia integerrima]